MKKACALPCFALVLVAFSSLAHAKEPDAAELLTSSDRARGGLSGGVEWDAAITTTEDGETSARGFDVKARGTDALVSATAPPRDKGQVFLFNDHEMWFLKTGLRKPVSISTRQRLSGQAANGDIASTFYSRDYSATLESKGNIGGEPVAILRLKAKNPKVTYDQIRYYVSTRGRLALKAEFLTVQGEVMKVATFEYGNRIRVGGESVPLVSKMVITDAKFPANRSVIVYSGWAEKNLSPSLFDVNNLAR